MERRDASRWRPALWLALATAGLLWGGWKWSQNRHYRRTLARVEEALETGLYALAAHDLAELLDRNPGSDEVAFLLGKCERARGRPQAAAAAWANIRPPSPFGFRALQGRVQLELEQGRLTAAEELIKQTGESSTVGGPDPRIFLGPIYCQEGRVGEAMRLIESLWHHQNEAGYGASEIAINQLRLYIELQVTPVSEEAIGATLDRAGRIAPDDDRIWLWKANWAIRTKAYQEAARLIDLCLKRRPDDPAVWRSRLDWAVATVQVAPAREALEHLPAAEWHSAQIEKLLAWFAAQRGDYQAERTALERMIPIAPTDFGAQDRLIELLLTDGATHQAARERRRKDEIASVEARYRTLFARNQPRRDAAEMGLLAERLGHGFEAKAFLSIALAAAPGRADIRRDLDRVAKSTDLFARPAGTLAERLAAQVNHIRVRSD